MAIAVDTVICNLALGHLGISKEIANVETEKSASAAACRRYLQPSKDETLRDFNWPFATEYVELGLVETSPNSDWAYSYRQPSNCVRIRKILSGIRNDTRQSRVPFEKASDDTGILIFTDEVDACLKYTKNVTDNSLYDQDYIMMLALLLASYIAPRVTSGDPFKMGERAFRLYIDSKTKAEATSLNEQQDEEPPEAESIRARES
ncbi:hypothetical protein KAR91_87425 [Candidatus Pacearchaeota archaeon]|nr:hypothetical protein [Candidatus Pacearchaeota archaeon]